jgi:hypothetical protein
MRSLYYGAKMWSMLLLLLLLLRNTYVEWNGTGRKHQRVASAAHTEWAARSCQGHPRNRVRGVTILAVCVAEPLSAGPVSTIPTAKLLSHAKSINHCLLEFLLKLAARGKHYLIYFLDTKQEISASKLLFYSTKEIVENGSAKYALSWIAIIFIFIFQLIFCN